MRKFFIIFVLLLCSCTSYKDYYKPDDDYLDRRQIETVTFETNDESKLLEASIDVLQDMGFTLDEIEPQLGLITAYKDRVITRPGLKALVIFVATLGGISPFYLTERRISVTIASRKTLDAKGYNVRADFTQSIMTNKEYSKQTKIKDPETYKMFFDRLSKSASLTAHNIQE